MNSKFLTLVLILCCFFGANAYGQIGQYALKFNGSSDYVSVPHNASLNFTQFTAEVWIFRTDNNETKIIGKAIPSSADYCFVMGISDGKLVIEAREWGPVGTVITLASPSGSVPLNQWTHVAMTWNSGGFLKGYINGVEFGSVASPSLTITNTNDMYIGKAPWNNISQNYFGGYMDEIRLWNVVRTGDEIRASMYKQLTGTEPNLAAYYSMNDGTGTTLTDNSSNTNDGTISGATWAASGALDGARKALAFDGGEDYIAFSEGNSPAFFNDNLTIEAWIKTTNQDTEEDIVSWGSTTSNNAVEFRMNEGLLQYGTDVGGWQVVTGNTLINSGEWMHVAITKDGNTVSLYVNGKLDATGTNTAIPNVNIFTIANLYQNGEYHNERYNFEGQIDEIRIWHATRSEAQIRTSMTKTLRGNEANLVGYFKFNEGNSSNAYDQTSDSKYGFLTNMDLASAWVSSTAFNTWIGAEDANVSKSINWSDGAIAPSQSAGLFKWTLPNVTTYDANITGTPTMNQMFIDIASDPTFASGATVNGNLYLNRNIALGTGDLEVRGSIWGDGLVSAIAGGYLAQRPVMSTPKLYPLWDGTNNYPVSITCYDEPTQSVKIRINNDQTTAGTALVDFWDVDAEDNLNATLRLEIPKTALKTGNWKNNNLFRIHNGSRFVPIPAENVTVVDAGNTVQVTIIGMNEFFTHPD